MEKTRINTGRPSPDLTQRSDAVFKTRDVAGLTVVVQDDAFNAGIVLLGEDRKAELREIYGKSTADLNRGIRIEGKIDPDDKIFMQVYKGTESVVIDDGLAREIENNMRLFGQLTGIKAITAELRKTPLTGVRSYMFPAMLQTTSRIEWDTSDKGLETSADGNLAFLKEGFRHQEVLGKPDSANANNEVFLMVRPNFMVLEKPGLTL